MKKKIDVIAIVLYLALSMVVLTSGLYLCDALPRGLTASIDSFFKTDDLPVNNGVIIPPGGVTESIKSDTSFIPSDMSGVWFDLGNELADPETASASSLFAEINSYFDYFGNFRSNTVFITPDIFGKYSSVEDSNGNSVDLLRETVGQAVMRSYYTVLVVNDSMLFNSSGVFDTQFVSYYLNNYTFDAVCISSEYLHANGRYNEAAAFFGDYIKREHPKKLLGIDIFPVSGGEYCSEDCKNTLKSGAVSFACVEGTGSLSSGLLPFRGVMSYFDTLAASCPGVGFYAVNRADSVSNGAAGFGSVTEISDEIRYVFDCENLDGFVLRNAYSLRKNDMAFARSISSLLIEPSNEAMLITRVSPDSEKSSVDFYGIGASGHKVYCNDKVAAQSGGAFKYTANLVAGENTFNFFCCGKTVTYSVYSNSHLIDSYYPSEDVNVSKDDVVNIYAVCLDGADVYAHLNSKQYKMEKNDGASTDGVPDGYSVYSCGVSFKNNSYMDLNLGNIKISAECSGSKETVTCGRVTLLKSDRSDFLNSVLEFVYSTFFRDSVKAPSQIENTVEKGISPYNDNGLGTSLMCRVLTDGTERLGTVSEYDTYHPTYSTLPQGMLDYVDNITVSDKGYVRYELRSGMSVYSTGVQLISNAYTMPENKIIVYKVDEASQNSTDIIFEKDWFSPIEITTSPQNFAKGYRDYSFNVSAFTAEYVDIKFYYTAEFYNKSLLNFDEASPFYSSELYSDGKGNMILRLYLRQKGQFYGYDIFENEDGRLVVSFKKHTDGSLAGKKIMLDPGHGGLSMTGTATRNDIAEAKITLAIALKARDMLASLGADVVMTRTAEKPLTLEQRVEILTAENPDLYVSIHCDGSENIADSGTHTFYYTPFSKPLATSISSSLVSVYRNYIYAPGDSNYSAVDRGTKYYPFFVTRMFNCPSVLVETGFLTNPVEGDNLANDNCQYWIAQGISDGIRNYFEQNN